MLKFLIIIIIFIIIIIIIIIIISYHFYSVKQISHTHIFYKQTIYTYHKIHIYTIDVQRYI